MIFHNITGLGLLLNDLRDVLAWTWTQQLLQATRGLDPSSSSSVFKGHGPSWYAKQISGIRGCDLNPASSEHDPWDSIAALIQTPCLLSSKLSGCESRNKSLKYLCNTKHKYTNQYIVSLCKSYLIVWHEKCTDSTVWRGFSCRCVVLSFILKMSFSVLPQMH